MANLNTRTLSIVLFACVGNLAFAQGYSYERPRDLVKGVITTIRDADIDDATFDDTREFSELVRVVKPKAWSPNYDPTTETILDKAKRISFQREVWSLEFRCKPLRVINVGGQNIWYLIYSVRNTGEVRIPEKTVDQTIEVKGTQKPLRFIPSFVLESHDLKKAFRAKYRPDVVSQIAAKERVTRGALHDSASISRMEIPVSTPSADRSVWGVATWDNVDPRADFISVIVGGLTNAYRWQPPKGGYRPGSPQQEQDVVQTKQLQLNFWRAGDNVDLNDNEITFGVPVFKDDPARQEEILKTYKLEKPLPYRWIYR